MKKKKLDLLPYALISPLIIFIICLALTPAVYTTIAAFFKVQPLNPPTRFSGLDNFRDIIHNSAVISSLGNTFLYILIGVTLSTVLGIYIAVVMQRSFKNHSKQQNAPCTSHRLSQWRSTGIFSL